MTEPAALLTRAEVLAVLAEHGRVIAVGTWAAYVNRKQAPQPVKHIGRTPLWDRGEIEAWVAPATITTKENKS